MWAMSEASDPDELAVRQQLIGALDEYCRSMTLRQAGEWFDAACRAEPRLLTPSS